MSEREMHPPVNAGEMVFTVDHRTLLGVAGVLLDTAPVMYRVHKGIKESVQLSGEDAEKFYHQFKKALTADSPLATSVMEHIESYGLETATLHFPDNTGFGCPLALKYKYTAPNPDSGQIQSWLVSKTLVRFLIKDYNAYASGTGNRLIVSAIFADIFNDAVSSKVVGQPDVYCDLDEEENFVVIHVRFPGKKKRRLVLPRTG